MIDRTPNRPMPNPAAVALMDRAKATAMTPMFTVM